MRQSSESPAAGRYPKGSFMGVKLKVAGWLALGAVAGALTTLQLEATARNSVAQLPLEELQQLAAVFGMVKTDYVEPVDEKKLIGDAIGGMVAGLDPHSQYFDKKTFKEFREQHHRPLRRHRHRDRHGRRPGEGHQPDRRLARLPRRPQERRPDHPHRRAAGQGPHHRPGRQAHARRAADPRRPHRLPQVREPHLPGHHHARGDPRAERARQDRRARLRLAARGAVPGPHRRGLRAQARRAVQAGAQHEGPGARPAQRSGRPARGRGRDLGRLPARRCGGRHHQRPDPRFEADLQGLARVLRAARQFRSAEAPARGR